MSKRRKISGTEASRRKGELLQIRLESSEKRAFEEAASLAGLAVSAWVRERLRRVARDELRESGRSVPFLAGADGSNP
jgi:hypothetical protein